jgi:hypothetical protein
MSARDAIFSIFKYLMAWQIVAFLIYFFWTNYWHGTWQDVLVVAFLVVLFMWVYERDKKYKVASGEIPHTPIEEVTVTKAIDIICDGFGIKNVYQEQIDLQTALIEKQGQRIAELEEKLNG